MKTTNTSSVTLITTPPSDILVVNAARVSFDKESQFEDGGELSTGDQRLLNYLASHNHWTPFSHVRETFAFDVDTFEIDWFMQAVDQNDLTGLVMTKGDLLFKESYEDEEVTRKPYWILRHSLYGWIKLLELDKKEFIFQPAARDFIIAELSVKYHGCMSAFGMSVVREESGGVIQYPTSHCYYVNKIDDVELYDAHKREYFIDYTVREEVPIFVARQRFKHMVGFTYNEVSRRYVDTPPEYFIPELIRGRAENKKQGSTETECECHLSATIGYRTTIEIANNQYIGLVDKDGLYKACPEQARGILPQSMLTSYYVTGNLAAWKRLISQRLDPHAQLEIQDLAKQLQVALGLELVSSE